MLSVRLLPLPCSSTSLLSLPPFSLSPPSPLPRPLLQLRAQRGNGGSPRVSKSRARRSGSDKKLVGAPMMDVEELGLGSFEAELGSEDEDEDDDGSVLLPLEKMKEWLEKRPRGFGEGRVYDTGVEDQLLDEMLQSVEAQAANIAKLKADPAVAESAERKKKAIEHVPNAITVRVTCLPKKRNVHRDLTAAFKGVPGLISINPMVSGTKKTRDPTCKGFAFVYFKSQNEAQRFIETFSKKSIAFGKIQKQIKCEMLDSTSSETAVKNNYASEIKPLELLKENTRAVSKVEVQVVEEEDQDDDYDTDDSFEEDEFESTIIVSFDGLDDDEVDESEWEEEDGGDEDEFDFDDDDEDEEVDSTELVLNESGSFEQRTELEPKSVTRTQEPEKSLRVKDKEVKMPKRNRAPKGKEAKAPKLTIPGSSKRLRVKEKAVLTDVFSKYGKKPALASKKNS